MNIWNRLLEHGKKDWASDDFNKNRDLTDRTTA